MESCTAGGSRFPGASLPSSWTPGGVPIVPCAPESRGAQSLSHMYLGHILPWGHWGPMAQCRTRGQHLTAGTQSGPPQLGDMYSSSALW